MLTIPSIAVANRSNTLKAWVGATNDSYSKPFLRCLYFTVRVFFQVIVLSLKYALHHVIYLFTSKVTMEYTSLFHQPFHNPKGFSQAGQ